MSSAMFSDEYDPGAVFSKLGFVIFGNSRLTTMDKPIGGLRVEGYDHVLVGEVRGFYPPPLVSPWIAPEASWAWEVTGTEKDAEYLVPEAAIEELKVTVGAKNAVAFRLVRRILPQL